MVKSIVELHGGEIFVNSRLGEGTEFRMILKHEPSVYAKAKKECKFPYLFYNIGLNFLPFSAIM